MKRGGQRQGEKSGGKKRKREIGGEIKQSREEGGPAGRLIGRLNKPFVGLPLMMQVRHSATAIDSVCVVCDVCVCRCV